MGKDTEERVKAILYSNLKEELGNREISINHKLVDLGINSISFIKIAVALESEFGMEFDDEELNPNRFRTVKDIIDRLDNISN